MTTYVDVMLALEKNLSDGILEVGEMVLNIMSKQSNLHFAEQYVCALMGKFYYNQKEDTKNAKKYLKRTVIKKQNPSSIYYLKTKEILEDIPSLI